MDSFSKINFANLATIIAPKPTNKKSKLTGKTLSESLIRDQTGGALIVGIKSASGTIITNPRGTIVLREGDVLIALGSDNHLQTLKDLAG